jgi:hypothetical protein
MKTIIAALALMLLAAGPTLAQAFTPAYPWNPNNGSLGGGSPSYNLTHRGQ